MGVSKVKRRKGLRLEGYDYSEAGAYFVTICTHDREELPHHYKNIQLDEFVVMPNHVHGIIFILDDDVGARLPRPYKKPTLGNMVAYYKYQSTKRINECRATPGLRVWQRNYYEHIIRNEKSLHKIQEYIATNPLHWEMDRENLESKDNDEFNAWLVIEGARKPKP